MDCCKHSKSAKKCIRKSDKKTFSLPRRFTRKRCKKGAKGFTMKASCAPYKDCKKGGSGKRKKRSMFGKILSANKDPTFYVTKEREILLSQLVSEHEDKAHDFNHYLEGKRLIDDINTKDFKKEQAHFNKLAKKVKTSLQSSLK